MKEKQLKELLESLSIEEKIGQLIQLSGDFYTEDAALKVGPQQKLGISREMVALSGSVLNVTGAECVRRIQESYLKNSRHKIPLLFMADVVYGYKTVYPIPLGIGASFNPQLITGGYRKTALAAMAAGVDIDMKTACYANRLKPLIEDGKISEEKIDAAVWRILKLKNKLGLFEDPYRGADAQREQTLCCCEEHRRIARSIAGESLVLLKNHDDLLPLKENAQKIALIGPYGSSRDLVGLWAVHAGREDTISLETALEEVLDEVFLSVADGCDYLEDASILGAFGKNGGEMTSE